MTQPPATLLKVQNLGKRFGGFAAVSDLSFELETGRIMGLVGPNGAGKTTTFNLISGFLKPTSGTVEFQRRDITQLSPDEISRQGLVRTFQLNKLFSNLTVEENIRIVLEPLGLSKSEITNRIEGLLADMKIQALAANKAHTLSGGERRRVEIMRALATRPRFILLDEPFAGIDPLSVADLQQIIHDLKDKGLGVLISDHNVRETLSVCDYAYIINHGKILTSGNAEQITGNKEARKMYLGEDFTM